MGLIYKAKEIIKRHGMLTGGERVIIGLSGGPDSICLLIILNNLKDEFKLALHALYIDHGLRPEETSREIKFCKKLCERFNIPFVTRSIDVKSYAKEKGINKQEAARHLRYQVFDKTAFKIKAQRIALGHTANDQAETLLMRLFRGSGPTGLSGIPPVRGIIIRPLIEIERGEIEGYLEKEEVEFIVDSSNLREDYLRNKIRLSLMPMLIELNPHIIKTLSKTAEIFREEERYLDTIIMKTLMKLIIRKYESRIDLFLSPLETLEKVVLRKTLRRVIDETKGLREISFIHIEDIIQLIRKGRSGDRLYLPKGIRVIKEYSTLVLTSEPPVKLSTHTLKVPGEIAVKEANIRIKASLLGIQDSGFRDQVLWRKDFGISPLGTQPVTTMAVFDAKKLTFPLIVRSRMSGDFFYPLGFGKKKKLQDFFVDKKISRDERDRIPLIVSGEDIVWVVGHRGDDRFKVTGETKKALLLEVTEIS